MSEVNLEVNLPTVEQWVSWTREHVRLLEYPSILKVQDDCPWNRSWLFDEDVYEFTSCFESVLSVDPEDLATRYTALSSLAILSLYVPDDEPDPDDLHFRWITEENEDKRYAFQKALRYFLHLFDPTTCNDWSRLKWEILTAYAADDLDFASHLYRRADSVMDLDSSYILRSQFGFLRLFGNELTNDVLDTENPSFGPLAKALREAGLTNLRLDSGLWHPVIYSDPTGTPLFWLYWCVNLDRKEPLRSQKDIDAAQECCYLLSTALRHQPQHSTLYLPMLARLYYAEGDFSNAARTYQTSLQDEMFRDDRWRRVRLYTFFALAHAYESSGEYDQAVTTLYQCADEFKTEPGILLRAAELEAKLTHYDAVIPCLENEKQRNPNVGEDWRESTLLALATIVHNEPFALREARFHQEHPDIAAGLDRLVTSFWTSFSEMSQPVKKKPCSAESMGRFWLWESSKRVIECHFHGIVGAESIRSSGHHSYFVVEALDGAARDLSFGTKPVQQ